MPDFLLQPKWMLLFMKILHVHDKRHFTAMVRATPDDFQFSLKVPQTVTYDNRLDINKGAAALLDEFLEKISPLKYANKLGAELIQLPPSSL